MYSLFNGSRLDDFISWSVTKLESFKNDSKSSISTFSSEFGVSNDPS